MSERGHLENIIGPMRTAIELRFETRRERKKMKKRIKELEARVKKLEGNQ